MHVNQKARPHGPTVSFKIIFFQLTQQTLKLKCSANNNCICIAVQRQYLSNKSFPRDLDCHFYLLEKTRIKILAIFYISHFSSTHDSSHNNDNKTIITVRYRESSEFMKMETCCAWMDVFFCSVLPICLPEPDYCNKLLDIYICKLFVLAAYLIFLFN